MIPPDPALVAAIRDAIDCEPLPSIHRLDCHCSPRDDASCLELRELLAALVASWVEPLEENLTKIHGNYQPACPFCVEHRTWSAQALAALPWRTEER